MAQNIQNNETSLCFVCCKSVSQGTSSKEGLKSTLSYEIYLEFVNFAELYLQYNASDWCYDSKLEVFCESCLGKLKRICELYDELCEAELHLSSKLRELGKLLGKPQRNVLAGEEKTGITTSLEEAGAVEEIRNFLASKCLKEIDNVKIKRTEDGSDEESSEPEEPLLERNEEDDDDDDIKLEVEECYIEEPGASEEEVEMEVDVPKSPLNNQRTESIKSEDNSSETEESIFEPGSEDSSEAESSDDEDEERPLQKRRRRQEKTEKSMINTNIVSDNNSLVCDQCSKFFRNGNGLYYHLVQSHEKQTKKQKTPCSFCSKSFALKQIQTVHMEIRHPSVFATAKPFKCDEKDCEESFETFSDLNAHLATHSKPIKFCSVCKWGFVNSDYLTLHELLHTPGNKGSYPCPSCKIKAANLMDLQVHYDRQHGARLGLEHHKCPECEKVFASRVGFKDHMRRLGNSDEDEDKRHKCCYCGTRYSDKEARRKHILEECIKNPYNNVTDFIYVTNRKGKRVKKAPCTHCGMLVRKEAMKGHVRTHFPEEQTRHICDRCGASFSFEKYLKRHIEEVHKKTGVKRKRVECQDCGKTFAQQRSLNEHVDRVHKGIDFSVICDLCGKVFSTRNCYTTHLKTHTDEKRHACHLCQQRYRGRTHLKKHLARDHGKTKGEEFTPGEGMVLKSICMFPSCGLKFGTSEELQAHVEQNHTPTGVKEFMCNLCGKVLANQPRLTRHNLVHTQEKPHARHLCSKAFNYKHYLKEHLQTVHNKGNEQFACDQPNCKSKFKIRKRLSNHMKVVHGLRPTKSSGVETVVK